MAMSNVADRSRVLVVEDEESYRDALMAGMTQEGFDVELAEDGLEGLRKFEQHRPDVVLLDVLLPGLDGAEVCRRMLEMAPSVPIIMVSALDSEVDVVRGLELGAVDYVTKPFSFRELLARVRTVLRRAGQPAAPESNRVESRSDVVTAGPVRMDFARRKTWVRNEVIHLSRQEFDLLGLLLSPPNQVRTRNELIDRLWSARELTDTRTLDTHVHRLRLKLEEDPADPRFVVTVRGVGFRYDSDGGGRGDAEVSAIADPVRREVLRIIGAAPRGEVCGTDLVGPLGKSQSNISHQLSVLSEAGLVHRQRRGKFVWYSLNLERLSDLWAFGIVTPGVPGGTARDAPDVH